MRCERCGRDNPEHLTFCEDCGFALARRKESGRSGSQLQRPPAPAFQIGPREGANEQGAAAAQIVLNMIAGVTAPPELVYPTVLVSRSSTGPVPA